MDNWKEGSFGTPSESSVKKIATLEPDVEEKFLEENTEVLLDIFEDMKYNVESVGYLNTCAFTDFMNCIMDSIIVDVKK